MRLYGEPRAMTEERGPSSRWWLRTVGGGWILVVEILNLEKVGAGKAFLRLLEQIGPRTSVVDY